MSKTLSQDEIDKLLQGVGDPLPPMLPDLEIQKVASQAAPMAYIPPPPAPRSLPSVRAGYGKVRCPGCRMLQVPILVYRLGMKVSVGVDCPRCGTRAY